MVDREFTETVDTAGEGGTLASKVGVRFFVATGEVNLGGIGGTKSKGVFHRRGWLNYVIQRYVRLVVAGGNTYWERMSGLSIT